MKKVMMVVMAMMSAVVSFGGMKTNGVLVASHRADWKLAPENSLAALENAIRYGVDIVETDVRSTKDGQLVILHDPHVARVTNGQGYVSNMTLEEIKRLNLRDALGQTTAEKIPTLEEYMLSAKGRVRLYLDKAGHDDRASLMGSPDDGWGWLVANGFTILETNFPREVKSWLKDCEINKGNNP